MPVAVYARVSTEEQRERQSIETQYDFGQRFCQMYALPVFRIYADDGVSGTIPLDRRPEGSQILRDARLGRFDQLLLYRLDRLPPHTRLVFRCADGPPKLGAWGPHMPPEFDSGGPTGLQILALLLW